MCGCPFQKSTSMILTLKCPHFELEKIYLINTIIGLGPTLIGAGLRYCSANLFATETADILSSPVLQHCASPTQAHGTIIPVHKWNQNHKFFHTRPKIYQFNQSLIFNNYFCILNCSSDHQCNQKQFICIILLPFSFLSVYIYIYCIFVNNVYIQANLK